MKQTLHTSILLLALALFFYPVAAPCNPHIDADALVEQAIDLKISQGSPEALKRSTELLQEAYDEGSIEALMMLAEHYTHGVGIAKNEDKAIELVTEWGERVGAEDQATLAYELYTGESLPHNFDLAVYWFTRSAEAGFPGAQYELGRIYQQEFKDLKTAKKWYLLAADQEHYYAYIALADIDLESNHLMWLKKAWELQPDYVAYNLALAHLYGKGTPKDKQLALEYFSHAAYVFDDRAMTPIDKSYRTGETTYYLNRPVTELTKEYLTRRILRQGSTQITSTNMPENCLLFEGDVVFDDSPFKGFCHDVNGSILTIFHVLKITHAGYPEAELHSRVVDYYGPPTDKVLLSDSNKYMYVWEFDHAILKLTPMDETNRYLELTVRQ